MHEKAFPYNKDWISLYKQHAMEEVEIVEDLPTLNELNDKNLVAFEGRTGN